MPLAPRLFGNRNQKFTCWTASCFLLSSCTSVNTLSDSKTGMTFLMVMEGVCLIRLPGPSICGWIRRFCRGDMLQFQNNPGMNLGPWTFCCFKTARLFIWGWVGCRKTIVLPFLNFTASWESLCLLVSFTLLSWDYFWISAVFKETQSPKTFCMSLMKCNVTLIRFFQEHKPKYVLARLTALKHVIMSFKYWKKITATCQWKTHMDKKINVCLS